MKVEKFGKNEGGAEISNFVPMGTFSICTSEHKRRYLKSSGFGPCIGLVLHSEEYKAGVLAHFMSKNGVQHSMERISEELRFREISSKQRHWTGVVFLGAQCRLAQKDLSTAPEKLTKDAPKSPTSFLLDIPSKPIKSASTLDDLPTAKKKTTALSGASLDLSISGASVTNARKRAQEILRILSSMKTQFVDDGFESCVFEVDTGRLILSDAKIPGYNDSTALKTDEGAALSLALSQMN